MESQNTGRAASLKVEFCGAVWYWKGPSPYYFLTVPEAQSTELKAIARLVTYGWGVIPVQVQIGNTRFTTTLLPKDGLYILPLKDSVRKAEGIEEGDSVTAHVAVPLRA